MTAAPSYSTNPPATNPLSAAPPARVQIEQSLEQLLQSLLELGICASDVQEFALETSVNGVASGQPGGLIGRKATQTIESFARLHGIKDSVRDVMIPLEVISSVDQGKNPHLFTKDFIERLSGENMYTNGILSAVSDYRDLLTEQMKDAFPDLTDLINQQQPQRATSNEPQASTSFHGALPPSASTSSTNIEASNGFPQNGTNGGNHVENGSNGMGYPPPAGGQHAQAYHLQGGVGENGDVQMEQDLR